MSAAVVFSAFLKLEFTMKRRRKQIPKGIHTATIEALSHDCRGIAKIEGKTVFIQGALPEEVIEFSYTNKKKDYDEGKVEQILSASELRQTPPCQHFDSCGGCQIQHLSTSEQILQKQAILLDLLKRFSKTTPVKLLAPLTSESLHYRNKARLSVRYVEKKQAVLIGFRERNNSRFIADINRCEILHKQTGTHLMEMRELLNTLDDKDSIAQIELAAGDEDQALIIRHLKALSENDKNKLKRFSDSYQYKVFLQPSGPDSIHLFYPESDDTFLSYKLPDFNLTFKFHPSDFTQVNAGINRQMVNQAVSLIAADKQDKILDLFCGLGNFSLALASRSFEVKGIEGSEDMVARAAMNARLNQIENCTFAAANLDDANQVRQLFQQHQGFNKLLIDPPRSGALEIVKQISDLNPKVILYISCNPVTLARDTDILVNQHQYKLQAAGVMDMFPHTTHVESIALFHRS